MRCLSIPYPLAWPPSSECVGNAIPPCVGCPHCSVDLLKRCLKSPAVQFLSSRWSSCFCCLDAWTPCAIHLEAMYYTNIVRLERAPKKVTGPSENVIQFPPIILGCLQYPKWVLWETFENVAASKLLSNAKFARTLRCFSSMSSTLSMSSFCRAVFLVTFHG